MPDAECDVENGRVSDERGPVFFVSGSDRELVIACVISGPPLALFDLYGPGASKNSRRAHLLVESWKNTTC